MSSHGVIAHCPRCGAAFHVAPAVMQTSSHGDFIRFTFAPADVKHECKGGES